MEILGGRKFFRVKTWQSKADLSKQVYSIVSFAQVDSDFMGDLCIPFWSSIGYLKLLPRTSNNKKMFES